MARVLVSVPSDLVPFVRGLGFWCQSLAQWAAVDDVFEVCGDSLMRGRGLAVINQELGNGARHAPAGIQLPVRPNLQVAQFLVRQCRVLPNKIARIVKAQVTLRNAMLVGDDIGVSRAGIGGENLDLRGIEIELCQTFDVRAYGRDGVTVQAENVKDLHVHVILPEPFPSLYAG